MNADHVIHALNGRRIGQDRFVFACPAHESKSGNSGKGRVLSGLIVLKDFGGCKTQDILAAAGLTFADLFEGSSQITTISEQKELNRRRGAAEGLAAWHEAELVRCAGELRAIDVLVAMINTAVREGKMSEDEAWDNLEFAYRGKSELEHRFEILHRGTDRAVLEIYRNG